MQSILNPIYQQLLSTVDAKKIRQKLATEQILSFVKSAFRNNMPIGFFTEKAL